MCYIVNFLQIDSPSYVGEDEFWSVGNIDTSVDEYSVYKVIIHFHRAIYGIPKMSGLVVDICYMPTTSTFAPSYSSSGKADVIILE